MKKSIVLPILFILTVAGFLILSALNKPVYQIITIIIFWVVVLYVLYRLTLLVLVKLRERRQKP